MDNGQFSLIESALELKLPDEYKRNLSGQGNDQMEELGIFNEPQLIIERTKEQRVGFGGAKPWPKHFLYIGDQDDACPYALDILTGSVIQTDHGDLTKAPLASYANLQRLISELQEHASESSVPKKWWKFW